MPCNKFILVFDVRVCYFRSVGTSRSNFCYLKLAIQCSEQNFEEFRYTFRVLLSRYETEKFRHLEAISWTDNFTSSLILSIPKLIIFIEKHNICPKIRFENQSFRPLHPALCDLYVLNSSDISFSSSNFGIKERICRTRCEVYDKWSFDYSP